jgi:hypothetical protein
MTLSSIQMVDAVRRTGYDPVRSRRRKLAGAIGEQLALIAAEQDGAPYRKTVRKRRRDLETDALTEFEEHRRLSKWWWHSEDESVYAQIRYGSAVLPLAGGKTVFAVADLTALTLVLADLKRAVLAGDFDAQLAEAAASLKRRFNTPKRKRAPNGSE